jgi:hypothetical protein
MSAISSTTRVIIKAYLEVFIENLVNEYRGRLIPKLDIPAAYLSCKSSKGQLKPFQAAIMPSELLRINEFERGFSSSLGTTYSTFRVSEVHNRGRDTAVPCPYGNRRAIGVYFINVESAV